MRRVPWWLLLVLPAFPVWAGEDGAKSLDELVRQVRASHQRERVREMAREKRFLELKDQREGLLKEAKAALAREKARRQALESEYQANQMRLKEARARLRAETGSLGELFGSVRQAASDARNLFRESMLSVTRPRDLELLDGLADARRMPSMEDMEGLWRVLLERMVEGAKVARFQAPVITADGVEKVRTVTRLGPFTAVSGGRFLRYLPEAGRLVELGRQPAHRYQAMARRLETADTGLVRMAVDPSRGAVLALLVRSPTLLERVRQGGVIGYVIIALGVLGVLLVVERTLILVYTDRRVRRQLGQPGEAGDNPLGRLLASAAAEPGLGAEALQLRMDELILKELPGLRRGLRLVAIIAAVAPLLGLLGTVTGMIETFQSITLFGTGDPRLMSGGISQALVTTELGLAVAIPLVLLHAFLSGRSNRLIQILDQQSAALVAERAGGG